MNLKILVFYLIGLFLSTGNCKNYLTTFAFLKFCGILLSGVLAFDYDVILVWRHCFLEFEIFCLLLNLSLILTRLLYYVLF